LGILNKGDEADNAAIGRDVRSTLKAAPSKGSACKVEKKKGLLGEDEDLEV